MPSPPDSSRSTLSRNQPITSSPDPKPRTHFLTFFNHHTTISPNAHMKQSKFKSVYLGGFGCGKSSPAPVSAPEFIRSAANWEAKKVKKKKKMKQRNGGSSSSNVVEVVPDVCCGPGIAFASDAALVDCVVESRRPVVPPRTHHRQRSSSTRHVSNIEHTPILYSAPDISRSQSRSNVYGGSLVGRIQRRSPGDLSEILMFQSGLLSGNSYDAYGSVGDWRVDVDNMSYEELLALSDRIGYVGTGLREEEIFRCLRKTKHCLPDSLPLLFSTDKDPSCSICQEEYGADDEVGKLECGHCYHINCIKQWLLRKNVCPVCKTAAASN